MKNKILTLSVLTALLTIGQSAIADTSDNDFTPFDSPAINQVADSWSNDVELQNSNDSEFVKASLMNSKFDNGFFSVESEDPFSINYSNDQ